MIKKAVTLKPGVGIDGQKPIALLVQEASQYASQIYIQIENKKINAKSIMGMMTLEMFQGEEATVLIEGIDEKEATEGLKTFFTISK